MTTWNESVEFPCGYKWEFYFSTWTAEQVNLPLAPKECPIHKINCKRMKT